MADGTLIRRCSKCRAEKAVSEFNVDRSRPSGRSYVCRACQRVSDPAIPNRIERRIARAQGRAWCRQCAAWFPCAETTKQGICRPHQREEDRRRYAEDPGYRDRRRAHSYKQRGVEAVPAIGKEYYLELFEGRCSYCPAPAETWDHVVPVSKGGATAPDNILPSCVICNSSKRDRDLYEWLEATGRELSVRAADHLSHYQVF